MTVGARKKLNIKRSYIINYVVLVMHFFVECHINYIINRDEDQLIIIFSTSSRASLERSVPTIGILRKSLKKMKNSRNNVRYKVDYLITRVRRFYHLQWWRLRERMTSSWSRRKEAPFRKMVHFWIGANV